MDVGWVDFPTKRTGPRSLLCFNGSSFRSNLIRQKLHCMVGAQALQRRIEQKILEIY